MIKNVVIVLGAQQSESAMHIHVSILPQNSPPTKAATSHWDQTSLCYTVMVIHFKFGSMYMLTSNSLTRIF